MAEQPTAAAILIVDDNSANVKLLRVLLEASGHQVSTASNAVEARAAVEARRPALILMDLQMPDVDGFTLTREFKARPELRDIPIIAVTAAAMRGDEERALRCGCDGYVTKPIETRKFIGTVARLLPPRPAC